MPWVTRFSRISGVQPIVSRTFPDGLVWGGIRVRLRGRAVRDRACRVGGRRRRVPPYRRGVASRRPQGRRGRGRDRGTHRRGPRLHRVRLPFAHRSPGLRVVELDRLQERGRDRQAVTPGDRKSTRLNSSHVEISYAVFCLKKKKKKKKINKIKKKKKKIEKY